MVGVVNRISGAVCEVATCVVVAAFSEYVTVIPGDPALKDERHDVDVALCSRHENQFQQDGLARIVTAYGDQIVPLVRG